MYIPAGCLVLRELLIHYYSFLWRFNMFKRFATTLMVLAIVGGSALADAKMGGNARQLSMGGAAAQGVALNPYIFEDPGYQYINPAYQGLYKDYGWSNIGGGTLAGLSTGDNGYGMQHGGVNFSLGQGWALGTILSHDDSPLNTLIGGLSVLGNSGLGVNPAEVFEAVTSYGWDHSHAGLSIMYGWTSTDQMDTTGLSELSGTVIGLRAGIHHDMGSGNAFEASAAFRSSSADDITPALSNEGSVTELRVSARAKMRVNNKVNFIPVGVFATASGDVKSAGTTVDDLSATSFALGAGGEITSGGLYLAGGVSFAWAQTEEMVTPIGGTTVTETISYTSFPTLNLGGEWWLTDWLAGRAGYYRAFVNTKTETPFFNPSITEMNVFGGTSTVLLGGYMGSDNSLVVLGLGARFGNFSLETTVSEEALRRGFGLAGAQDNINSFGYFTAGWNFE